MVAGISIELHERKIKWKATKKEEKDYRKFEGEI